MQNNFRSVLGAAFVVISISSSCRADDLDIALRDYISSGNAKIPVIKPGLDELVFEDAVTIQSLILDIDGDGSEEFIVGSGGDPRWSTWALYTKSHDESKKVKLAGSLELNMSTMRIGMRDGKKGYYEYYRDGGGSGNLTFNSFDEKGNLVALWEAQISPERKDKELYDSIYHSNDFSKPDIQTTSVKDFKKVINALNIARHSNRPTHAGRGNSIIKKESTTSENTASAPSEYAPNPLKLIAIISSGIILIIAAAIAWRQSKQQRSTH